MTERAFAALVLAAAVTWAGAGAGIATPAADEAIDYTAMRLGLVQRVARHASALAGETGIGALHPRVLGAMAEVPRHAFVPEPLRPVAYQDTALPFTHGQTISQPFMIALMIHLAEVDPGDVVFETGTGAGYPAALLAKLARRVYSVAFIAPLGERAAAILERLGYGNVAVRVGDGYNGWPERGPYDAIIVKAAVNHVPPPLAGQLKPGGRLVIPLGPPDGVQQLTVIEKDAAGRLRRTPVLPVRFLPMPGGERI